MAIKQRALRKLNTTTDHMIRAMSTESKAAVGGVCHDLEELRDLYREGLPQQDYATYGEVCDGLLLAVQKMLEDGAADVSGDATALCKELLEYLGTETEKETHFKKEIVFLPYQASMWDSLESVWKAAYEDKEHCIAYVMPIPYADLNPDRSVAAWHCERDQFPKYVPTLDWQEVDLKAWHPDAIFYHNPYDNCNFVTSVESRYYSRNLKECADKLVYIPYFVLEEPCTEESVEHFVLTPGVLNANQVIVQSEAMRELYINILTKRTNHTDRSFWEKRISGAGSPKIEKVLTSKKEDFDMPEKWRKLVEGKKVILYNTSLSAMLQNSDKVCDKLRYVFDVFRNRDDVVLWWRPHPLMKSTFHSMRPQFEDEYLSLEKQYIDEGWGIYDDSPDLHRAICWSDGYYGDGSSILALYRKSGKSMLLQNLQRANKLNFKLYFEYITIENEKIWGVSQGSFIGLYEINLKSEKVRCLGELPIRNRQSLGRDLEYAVLGKVNEKIVIAPYFSRDGLIVYDMIQKTFDYVPIALDMFPHNGAESAFVYAFTWKERLYFLGNRTGIILEYNPQKHTVSYHDKWSKKVRMLIGKDEMFFERQGYVQKDNYLYMVVSRTGIIVRLNMNTLESIIHKIPDDFRAINLCYDGAFFWIIPMSGEYVVRWNEVDNFYQKVKLPQGAGKFSFIGGGVVGDYVVLFPCMANYVLCIDRHRLNVMTDTVLERYIHDIHTDKYVLLRHESERIFAFLRNRMVQEFNVMTGEMMVHHFKADFSAERDMRINSQYGMGKDVILYEAEDMDVDLWIDTFLQIEDSAETVPEKIIVGANIYNESIEHG